MAKKLQNIKAVKQMLAGTHKFQTKKTFGFSDTEHAAKQNKKRDVGDVWEEEVGEGIIYIVEQKDGYRMRSPKNSVADDIREYLNSYPKCRTDRKTTNYNHLDKKMRKIHGMCYDCVIDMEHNLRVEGKYEEYEKQRIHNNAKSWLKIAEQDVEALKKAYTESSTYITNADGLTETWSAKMTPEEFEEKVQDQFSKFKKEFLENLDKKEKNEDD
mgnify:CR=1 FL=1